MRTNYQKGANSKESSLTVCVCAQTLLSTSLRNKRSQSALEYMMTYGWAILIIVIVAAVLYGMGIFSPSSSVQQTVTGFSGLGSVQALCSSNQELTLQLGNSLGEVIKITNITVTGSGVHNSILPQRVIQPSSLQNFNITGVCPSTPTGYSLSVSVEYTEPGSVFQNTLVTSGTLTGTTVPVSTQTLPAGVVFTTKVTVTNNQNTSTSSPFQQMVNMSNSVYKGYAASNLQNVEFFYYNGTIIPSWLESYTYSKNALYWLKLGSIGANSTDTIYVGFASNGTNLFNGNTVGEAPQLSSTYGQYDNGANVFSTFYQNFVGTGLPSGWTGSGYSINNGLSLPYSSYALTSKNYGLNSTQILDYYGNFPLATADHNAGFGYTLSSSDVTASTAIQTWFEINTAVWSNAYAGGLVDQGSGWNATSALTTGYNVYSIYWPSSSEASFSVNYDTPSVLTKDVYGSQLPIGGANTQISQATIGPFYWVRVRADPPSGVMPSVAFGSIS